RAVRRGVGRRLSRRNRPWYEHAEGTRSSPEGDRRLPEVGGVGPRREWMRARDPNLGRSMGGHLRCVPPPPERDRRQVAKQLPFREPPEDPDVEPAVVETP